MNVLRFRRASSLCTGRKAQPCSARRGCLLLASLLFGAVHVFCADGEEPRSSLLPPVLDARHTEAAGALEGPVEPVQFRDKLREYEEELARTREELAKQKLEESEQALARAERNRARAVKMRNWSFLGGIASIACSLAIASLYRQRRRALAQVQALNHDLEAEKAALTQALQDRKAAYQDLFDSNRRLKEIDEERKQLLGLAAHDMRNPVAAIQAAVQILETVPAGPHNPSPARKVEPVRLIAESAHILDGLIDSILNTHRAERELKRLQLRSVPLEPLVQQVIEMNRPAADRKEMLIAGTFEEKLIVKTDPAILGSAIDNLISNAVKYAFPGTLIEVEIAASMANQVVVEVRDRGPGLHPEEFPKLFKPFSKLSNQPTGGEPSTGLGLASVAHAMKALGGETYAKNRAEGGACFGLVVPQALG